MMLGSSLDQRRGLICRVTHVQSVNSRACRLCSKKSGAFFQVGLGSKYFHGAISIITIQVEVVFPSVERLACCSKMVDGNIRDGVVLKAVALQLEEAISIILDQDLAVFRRGDV